MPVSASRFILREWSEAHRNAFAAMHSDPEVMADQGGPVSRAASDEKFDRYAAAWADHGTSRWAIEDNDGLFLGYTGVMFRADASHSLGEHHEIGWRLCRAAWGKGIASESAGLALHYAWQTLGVHEIVAYTSPDNIRSQSVMDRLALRRDRYRDFKVLLAGRPDPWTGWVWVADRPLSGS